MAGTEEITFIAGVAAAAAVQTSPLEGRADVVLFPRFRTAAAATATAATVTAAATTATAAVMRVSPSSENNIRQSKLASLFLFWTIYIFLA